MFVKYETFRNNYGRYRKVGLGIVWTTKTSWTCMLKRVYWGWAEDVYRFEIFRSPDLQKEFPGILGQYTLTIRKSGSPLSNPNVRQVVSALVDMGEFVQHMGGT